MSPKMLFLVTCYSFFITCSHNLGRRKSEGGERKLGTYQDGSKSFPPNFSSFLTIQMMWFISKLGLSVTTHSPCHAGVKECGESCKSELRIFRDVKIAFEFIGNLAHNTRKILQNSLYPNSPFSWTIVQNNFMSLHSCIQD